MQKIDYFLTAAEIISRRSAFAIFEDEGIENVKKYFPEHVEFCEKNSHATLEEITERCTTQLNENSYLEMTGDSIQQLMGGACCFGPAKIKNLVSEALRLKKRIVWHPDLSCYDKMDYTFEDL